MRSVVVFLRDVTEIEVTAYLQQAYTGQEGPPWVALLDGEAYLYIYMYRDGPTEYESDVWLDIIRQSGGEPTAAVIADVSGRHPGKAEVAEFVLAILTRFSGAAMDDYTTHLWSLPELQSGQLIEGHAFFDYEGWFAENEL